MSEVGEFYNTLGDDVGLITVFFNFVYMTVQCDTCDVEALVQSVWPEATLFAAMDGFHFRRANQKQIYDHGRKIPLLYGFWSKGGIMDVTKDGHDPVTWEDVNK